MPIEMITSHYTTTFFGKQLACVFPYFLFSYDVITTLGHKRLCTVIEMMSLYSWVVRPWRPHRYEGPHHSTQDLKCICQIRDNDLIYDQLSWVPQKWGAYMLVPPSDPNGVLVGQQKWASHIVFVLCSSLCIMHLMYVYIHENS